MTPQERQLVDDLFDRLARLETTPRDPDADHAIAQGLQQAPHAVYALVQTVLVQDEALRRADERIRELTGEGEPEPQGGGFLDSMRSAIMGRPANASVPSVRPGTAGGPDPRWNTGGVLGGGGSPYANAAPAPMQAPTQGGFGGGSFLGTAAASAAGAIGGALLFNSISSMFGGHRGGGSAFADAPSSSAASPWGDAGGSSAGSDLARDAGLGDLGSGSGANPTSTGLFGDNSSGNDDDFDIADADDDFGSGFDGGSDSESA